MRIAKTEVLGIMGLYNEVPEQLEQIQREELSPGSLLYYYYTCRTFYGWIADYTQTEDRHKYIAQTNAYRDSILSVTPDGTDHNIVLADKLIVNGKPDEAIELMNKELEKAGNTESSIYILYNLSLAYAQKRRYGKTDLLPDSNSNRRFESGETRISLVAETGIDHV
ncbi:MAG: hypothetical protein LUD46_05170 [Parabacteroides sp.]|nr:hypothetical protein [Parabacteroides sp.]